MSRNGTRRLGLAGVAISLLGGASTGCAPRESAGSPDALRAASLITPAGLRRHLEVIADDSMKGRATPSAELMETARYVALQFREAGLEPGAGEHYLQVYPTGNTDPAGLAPNTVGLLRGSDPALRHEYVLLSAHMDHVGVGPPVAGDSIYNGADDDASGTVTVVQLARAFASLDPAPRRSIVFLAVSGEEKGLLGSRYYVANAPFPLTSTVADLNLDMLGRNWSDTIVVIGMKQSTLGSTVRHIAAEHPELDMAVIDDPWPEESFYTRSDHYTFARSGVPALFFFNGTHEDYHRPSDEASRIDYEKMARVGRLVFYVGLEIANRDRRPSWSAGARRRLVEGAGS